MASYTTASMNGGSVLMHDYEDNHIESSVRAAM
jgi:hypothetical protein